MNALLTLSIILISNLSFTQDYPHELPEYLDYLLDKNNKKISCNIREIKNGKVKFLQEDKIYIKTEDLSNFSDVKFSETNVLKNTLNIEIQNPSRNYANIYFYASNDIPYTVMQNKKKVVKISNHSYYLHKVEAGKTYEFYCFGNPRKSDKLVFQAKDGKTYIVKGIKLDESGRKVYSRGVTTKLIINNSKLSKYALVTMSRKAKK
jgi:hypothetical protein